MKVYRGFFKFNFVFLFICLSGAGLFAAPEAETEKNVQKIVIEDATGEEVSDDKPVVRKKRKTEQYLIEVTAQKRKQSIQDVAGSVSALNVKQIEDAGIESTSEIHDYVPNFSSYSLGNGFSFYSIRGQSNFLQHVNSVGIYIDDVPIVQSAFMSDSGLYEIERIEVLRGAQGNLYGFNSSGGVVNIITKKPDSSWSAKASGTYGNYNLRGYNASVSGPVVKDNLYMGFSGMYSSQDGYIENTGEDTHKKTLASGRFQTRWTPANKLDVLFTASLNKRDQDTPKWTFVDGDPYKMPKAGMPANTEVIGDRESLRIKYIAPWFEVISVTARTAVEYEADSTMDYASGGENYGYFLYDDNSTNWMQELRLGSINKKSPLQWLAGAFYLNSEIKSNMDMAMDSGMIEMNPPSGSYSHSLIHTEVRENAASVFGQAAYTFFKRLTVTGGARYDYDRKKISLAADPFFPPVINADDTKTDHVFSPRVSVDLRVNNSVMTYANAARGYKSGGYAAGIDNLEYASFDPEYSWTFEGGVKTNWLRNRIIANLAAFYTMIDDVQILDINTVPRQSIFKNAAEAHVAGVELETMTRPVRGLEVIASFGYLFSEFTKHNNKECEGNKLPFSPDFEAGIALQYLFPMGIFVRGEGSWHGKAYHDEGNTYKQDGYLTLNAKVGYKAENVNLGFYVNNILNKEYYNFTNSQSMSGRKIGAVGAPRTFGGQVTLEF